MNPDLTRNLRFRPRAPRQRGAVLGVYLVLLLIVSAASALALWGVRADLGSAGQGRLSRQLFACSEQALEMGKQHFGGVAQGRWNAYLATPVCSALPCPPFPPNAPGPAESGYPSGSLFTGAITLGGVRLNYQIGIYNNTESPASPFADGDGQVFVYARCTDPISRQSRALQALISPAPSNGDYVGQAGGGLRNQGNLNN